MSWFATWFDSPLYHKLYQHRDEAEAEAFIERLVAHEQLAGGRLVDVACGKGRHARHLARLLPRAEVFGLDLAPTSIAEAGADAAANCHFAVHDMLLPLAERFGKFNAVFNLFTSFGYFEQDAQHQLVMQYWAAALHQGGRLYIDFINAQKAIAGLVAAEEKLLGGYRFEIRRSLQSGYIVKDIAVQSPDSLQVQHFQERVRAFGLADFEAMGAAAGLQLVAVWGDYQLGEFDPAQSPRLILTFAK